MIQGINRLSINQSDIITFLRGKKKILLPTANVCKTSLRSSHVLFAVAPEIKAIINKDDDNKPTGTERMTGKTDLVLSYKLSTNLFVVLLEKQQIFKT